MPIAMYTTKAFPPPPVETITWSRLGSAISTDNGHSECLYNAKTGGWSKPKFVRDPYLKIHGLAPGLNYGQQAYEGMKTYRGPDDQIYLFRPDFHASRMASSASTVSIPPIPSSIFIDSVKLAVSRNAEYVPPHAEEALLYVRPVVFGSSGHLGLTAPEEFTFCVYTQPGNAYHGVQAMDALIMEEFDRAAPNGTGAAKVGGNYAPVIKWSDKARSEGYGLTLHLDSKTQSEVEEFSTSGFVGVKIDGDGYTLIVPDSKNVIQSVTSDSCLELAESQGWKIEKRPIKYSELGSFSEVIAVGTAAALLPIKSITRKSTSEKFVYRDGSPEAGPCCVTLSKLLKDIQKGRTEDTFGWRMRVDEMKDYSDMLEPKIQQALNSSQTPPYLLYSVLLTVGAICLKKFGGSALL